MWWVYPAGQAHELIKFWRTSDGNFFLGGVVVFMVKHYILGMVGPIGEMKRKYKWVLGQLFDLGLWPHPWPEPWIFKVKIWNRHISVMGEPTDMEWKGFVSIGCWTHYVTLTCQGQIFKQPYVKNGRADLTWNKLNVGEYDVRPTKFLPHPWPWPWIFKVKFLKTHISGMGGGSIDMESNVGW